MHGRKTRAPSGVDSPISHLVKLEVHGDRGNLQATVGPLGAAGVVHVAAAPFVKQDRELVTNLHNPRG